MISCELHDHIEIVCLYRYSVKLTLKSGAEVEGIALDTRRNAQREECLVLNHNDHLIVLEHIKKMEVLVENPHFKVVCFN